MNSDYTKILTRSYNGRYVEFFTYLSRSHCKDFNANGGWINDYAEYIIMPSSFISPNIYRPYGVMRSA